MVRSGDSISARDIAYLLHRALGLLAPIAPGDRSRVVTALRRLHFLLGNDESQLVAGFASLCQGTAARRMVLSFCMFDEDQDGSLSEEQFARFIHALLMTCLTTEMQRQDIVR